jgi:hypothetical protein
MPMPTGYEGYAALGDALGGGDGMGDGMGSTHGRMGAADYQKKAYDTAKAWNEAQKTRSDAIIRAVQENAYNHADANTQAYLRSTGASPEAAALGGTFASGGNMNFNEFMGGAGKIQENAIQKQAWDAAKLGDVHQVNLLNAVHKDAILDQTKIGGGVAYNPLETPDQALHSTPLGDAQATASQALADQRGAHADVYAAQAGQGGFNPNTGRGRGGGSGAAPEKFSEPSAAGMKQTLGDANGDIPEATKIDFALFNQAHRGDMPNGSERLQSYKAQLHSGGIHIIDPSMPGSMTQQPDSYAAHVAIGDDMPSQLVAEIRAGKHGANLAPPVDPTALGNHPAAAHARDPRISQGADGLPIVDISNAAEAKAAWAKLGKGASLRFPNGTIKRKP